MSQKSVSRAAKLGTGRKTGRTATSPNKSTSGTSKAKAKTTDEDAAVGRKTGKRKTAGPKIAGPKIAGPKIAGSKIASLKIDWPAVEVDWRAGIAVRELARRNGISPSAIYRRARKHRWRRAANPDAPSDASLDATTGATTAPSAANAAVPGTPGRGAVAARSPAPDDLARLRSLAVKLRERLERVIDGEAPADAVLGARESPAALLLKLCQITEKIIAIERRVAGADAPTPAELNEQDRDILNRFKRRYGVG